MKKLNGQSGISFGGFIMFMIALVVVAIFSLKLIPAYMDNGKIQKAFDAIVADPSMQTATVAEVRDSFYKRAITMDNVTVLTANDIEIYKDNGRLFLSAKYSSKVPVAGNVSLVIDFSPTAPKQ